MTAEYKMEEKQQGIRYVMVSPESLQNSGASDDEIDLRELWNVIWAGKWIIIAIAAIFSVMSVFYALSLPNIYKSEALLAPVTNEQQSGLGALSGQFGGLASLAGINLGGGGNDKTGLAIEIIKSREFISKFIQRHNVLPDLMAVKGWDLASNTVIYDTSLYDPLQGKWLREAKPPKQATPSLQEAHATFIKVFAIDTNKQTGMVVVSVQHQSAVVAKLWVDWLIQDINLEMKSRDKEEAEKSTKYLQSQIEKTSISEHKTLLYELIEEQAKTLMFAEVRDEYVFKTIDPALVSEMKDKPKRALIVIIATFMGGILGLFLVIVRSFFSKKKIDNSSIL